jgi:hypothetical protein
VTRSSAPRVGAPAGPGRASAWAGPWRALLWRTAALPVLVTLPLWGLAFRADERFNVYRFGAEYGHRPQGLLTDQIRNVPFFLRNGNFRPVGRVVERLQELLAFQAAEALGIAPSVAMRVSASLWLGVLAVTVVLVVQTLASAERLQHTVPVGATPLVGPLFAVGLVAAGNQSAVVLFTNLYAHASLVVLGAGLLAARREHLDPGRPASWRLVAAAVVGALCASFNEIGYLAAPAVVLLPALRGRVALGLAWQELAATAATRLVLAFAVGFAAVFVPVRVLIARLCADAACYAQSAIELSPDALGLLVQRVTSWFPPAAWSVATGPDRWYLTSNGWLVLAAATAGVVTVQLLRLRRAAPPTPVAVAVALVAAGLALTVLPGVIGAISEGRLDDWRAGDIRAGAGWRDTPLLLAGTATALAGVIELVAARLPDRVARPVGLAASTVLVLALAGTLVANDTFAGRDAAREEPNLHQRIAAEVVSFDRSEEADARRCDLLDEFAALHPGATQHQERLRLGLDEVGRRAADRPWCEAAS